VQQLFCDNDTMRALVQRVTQASVTSQGELTGTIGPGLCVLVGTTHDDELATASKMADKLWNLRIFEDESGAMNRSAADDLRPLLVVSQFTLYGDAKKGRRPSFVEASRPEHAEPIITALIDALRSHGATVETGRFRTDMQVSLINDGPITLMVEL
jgi:D-tyrosyl-tRNA(Tyr) deacylase